VRALFDVSVLIALFQPNHVHHETAHRWWGENKPLGWATCPITENGFVRIISQPKYPVPQTVSGAITLMSLAQRDSDHEFWPDTLSILDKMSISADALSNHAQITGTYLLALAIKNKGRLVTLDQNLKTSAVSGFIAKHLVTL
jgi:uncharacterized protein